MKLSLWTTTVTAVRIHTYEADVCDKNAINRVMQENKIDCVIHFAGLKAVGESVKLPLTYYRNNIDTTLTLLECMQKNHVNNIVFSSSATVYGEENDIPYIETMQRGSCTNPYGWTKWMIEQILTDLHTADPSWNVVLLRYFNPIGAHPTGMIGKTPNGIPNNLMPYITQVAVGIRDHLSVFGNDYPTPDGTCVRDYIHVVDLAKGHVAAYDYSKQNTGCEIFNLGTGIGYSVLDIVHAFEEANQLTLPFEFAPRREGDIAICYSNSEKAEKLLGWKAGKTLHDMCRDSWNWQKKCVEF